jgi:ABC-2 type transport system permease protein
MLKGYPLRGWQLILGELLAPVAILSGITWLFLLMAALAGSSLPEFLGKTIPAGAVVTLAGCAALVAPALLALQLIVVNAATLVFPAWFQPPRVGHEGGGIEVMGQRLIFVVGNLLALVLALLPAAILGGSLVFILHHFIGVVAASILATLAVLAVLVGEVWCGIWLLGERFEKFDLSAELRP